MDDPRTRDDLSKFVVHLTRRYNGQSARANLLSILDDKVINARNAHCLFHPDIARLEFTPVLQRRFETVCFTETPLTQIGRLTAKIPGRRIQLEPYGLVFYKKALLERDGNPAIYINGNTHLRDYLLKQFRDHFQGIKSLRRFKEQQRVYHKSIIQYYSLVNVIRPNHDFTWEREWRFNGDFKFKYIDVVAIFARQPNLFQRLRQKQFSGRKLRHLERLPIISADWTYEDIVETMSAQIWNDASG